MNWKHETWRKLYVREEGSFAGLSYSARALAAMLLKLADDDGMIYARQGDQEVVSSICARLGADQSERRIIRRALMELVVNGYLIPHEEGSKPSVRIRNFTDVQGSSGRGRDADRARSTGRSTPRGDGLRADRARTESGLSVDSARTERGLRNDLSTESPKAQELLLVPSVPSVPSKEDRDPLPSGEGPGSPSASRPAIASKAKAKAEPKPERRERRSPPTDGLYASVLEAFCATWREARGAAYHVTGADRSQLGRILSGMPAEISAELPAMFRRYLADSDAFLEKQAYSLAWFCTGGQGLNKYRGGGRFDGASAATRTTMATLDRLMADGGEW